MDKDLATALGRLDRYLDRVKEAIRKGDLVVALADIAELGEIARRLSVRLEHLVRASYAGKGAADQERSALRSTVEITKPPRRRSPWIRTSPTL
jgi:hypothetical protein